ncbi:hypothetical protein D3C72_1391410 [compost metagenome]
MPTAKPHTESFVATQAALQRRLPLEKVHNARDLGGLTGIDGRRLRTGKLFRSGNPGRASAADLDRLGALGLESSHRLSR